MTDFTQEAKKHTPYRSGTARNGWRKKGTGRNTYSQNRVPYVGYLDEGTNKMKPANGGEGIVKPAIQEATKKIKRKLR